MQNKRILILCSYDNSLIHFRGDFIKSLVQNGYEVYGAAPEMSSKVSDKLVMIGAHPLSFNLHRTGLNPYRDIKSILEIKKLIDTYKIDIVFPYTIKPVVYGSIAANFSKVSVISLITGLGFTFSGTSIKSKILQKLTEFLYKISIRKNKLIIFQNADDHKLFLEQKIIDQTQKFAIVDGSGVNFDLYPFRENINDSDKIIFIIVARLIKEKGINLFIEAAETLKKTYPRAEFHVIGAPPKTPSAIKMEKLQELHSQKVIVYHGQQKNVPDFLSKSDVFVLPSYYREGIPRSILEALSIGMPIITTDSPGCRETIENGENGILIQPQNSLELIASMKYFLQNPAKINIMGLASRKLAEKKFEVSIINDKLISLIAKET